MYLKRKFEEVDDPAEATHMRQRDGAPIRVTHVEVLHAGPRQHITPKFIERNAADGILSMGGGKITLKTADGEPDLVYRIQRAPGLFCCHCEQAMDDSASAQAHVAEEHDGDESPDPGNPSGYRKDNFYACVKED